MKIVKFKKSFNLFNQYEAITIGIIIIVFNHDCLNDKIMINHESIHGEQYKETLFIGFLLLYFGSWLFNLIKYMDFNKAYMNIIFEKESYGHEKDLNYLKNRKRYNWLKYLIPHKT